MNPLLSVTKREFLAYFRSPLAYVFLIFFLLFATGLTWYVTRFFDAGRASLDALFNWFPWLFALLIPAVGMRLWSEEKRGGTWELLFTLPLTVRQAVLGKFLAAWAFIALAILGTLTLAFTASYLGDPDWGPLLAGYVGSLLLAAAYLGLCSLASALTRSQVIAFVASLFACLLLVFLGLEVLKDFLLNLGLPLTLTDALARLSFFTHFQDFSNGIVTWANLLFPLSFAAVTLLLNVVALER